MFLSLSLILKMNTLMYITKKIFVTKSDIFNLRFNGHLHNELRSKLVVQIEAPEEFF